MNERTHVAGFSLVEVVVAMGLISFAMIAILAFFPSGLSSNRSSVQDTRAAQIAHAVAGTIDSQSATCCRRHFVFLGRVGGVNVDRYRGEMDRGDSVAGIGH